MGKYCISELLKILSDMCGQNMSNNRRVIHAKVLQNPGVVICSDSTKPKCNMIFILAFQKRRKSGKLSIKSFLLINFTKNITPASNHTSNRFSVSNDFSCKNFIALFCGKPDIIDSL